MESALALVKSPLLWWLRCSAAAAQRPGGNTAVALALAYTGCRLAAALRRVYAAGLQKTFKAFLGFAVKGLQVLPGASAAIESQLEPELENFRQSFLGDGDSDANTHIPVAGLSAHAVRDKALALKAGHTEYASGLKWAGVYHEDGGELTELQNQVWGLFNNTNTLYPTVFPAVRKFEAELITMVLATVHGVEAGAVGLLTSGGTESILLAVLGYRQQGLERGVTEPEIVSGITAHPALMKACHYFGVKLVLAAVDATTQQLLPAAVLDCITRNTVAVYGSCPTFSHGVIDPIEELGAVCQARGIGLHVDNCLGGVLVSYLCKLGQLNLGWDFAVPGVTSISVDLHKYGFASKGVSVICFREPKLRRLTYVPSSDGCEGMYVTPTLQGSRSGGVIAQAWATVLHLGDDGYRQMARDIHQLTEQCREIVARIPELGLLVSSSTAIVPIVSTSSKLSIYQVAGLLEKKGWNMFTGQKPAVMSLCLGVQHLKLLDRWGQDLEDAVKQILANPDLKITGGASVYGAAAVIPDELLDSVLRSYCDIRMCVKKKAAAASS